MLKAFAYFFFFTFMVGLAQAADTLCSKNQKYTLALHKGTGENTTQTDAFVEKILLEGSKKLEAGEKSLDVVEFVVSALEDSGLFNAGKDAVSNSENEVELDASIMDGSDLSAGAVAAVKKIKNPIQLARLVKDKSKHLFLVAGGAEKFALSQKVKLIDPKKYFNAYKTVKTSQVLGKPDHWGTVGAVALDRCGNVAAATSTGGLENKLPGRVGDSPIIGAGTYANNNTCAVSATGEGEFFIRATVAQNISALMEYKDYSLQKAAHAALDKLSAIGGHGGVISVDTKGNVASSQNTAMTTAYVKNDHKVVFLGKDFVEKK